GLCAAVTACRRRLRGADGFGRVTGRRWSCWGTRFREREGDGAGRRGGRGRRRPWLTASVACEQGPASAFMGEQGEGEGDGRGQGGSGSSGSGRGCRRAWRARRSGESARA